MSRYYSENYKRYNSKWLKFARKNSYPYAQRIPTVVKKTKNGVGNYRWLHCVVVIPLTDDEIARNQHIERRKIEAGFYSHTRGEL